MIILWGFQFFPQKLNLFGYRMIDGSDAYVYDGNRISQTKVAILCATMFEAHGS